MWVGLTDKEEEGVYRWVDERPTTTEQRDQYQDCEPNDRDGTEDCTTVKEINRLNDISCNYLISLDMSVKLLLSKRLPPYTVVLKNIVLLELLLIYYIM